MASSADPYLLPHIAIFPFMAKGHTIPLIHLVHHLRRRRLATVTFFTTPGNAAFVRDALPSGADTAVIELVFPAAGAESAEGVTSMAAFASFVDAASLLRPQLEASLAAMRPPASLLIADVFLHWANAAAAPLGVPTASFFGISAFAQVMRELRIRHDPLAAMRRGDVDPAATKFFTVPEFPRIRFTFEDLMAPFGGDPSSVAAMKELNVKLGRSIHGSRGLLVNTFHALEGPYLDFWNQQFRPRCWAIGPLFLSRPATAHAPRPSWMAWLDENASPVLYVALGTLAAIPEAQLRAVADGLERAGVGFIWAVKPENADLGPGFEERTKGRGLVVREWVDQPEILHHRAVRGFLSHCGWNSVLESVAAGVPLAAWPMQADQAFNARFVVDELKIAVRVRTIDLTMRGLVTSQEISGVVRELMLGEAGAEAGKNVAELAVLAKEAVAVGGLSWNTAEEMIAGLCATNNVDEMVFKARQEEEPAGVQLHYL